MVWSINSLICHAILKWLSTTRMYTPHLGVLKECYCHAHNMGIYEIGGSIYDMKEQKAYLHNYEWVADYTVSDKYFLLAWSLDLPT